METLRTLARLSLAVVLAAAASACQMSEHEEEIALAEVPRAALEAAQEAVPGIAFEEAERERHGDQVVYCLHGRADGVFHEVEVTAAGEVLEIETGDEHDEDHDHDDD